MKPVPAKNSVLIIADKTEEKSEGGIILPDLVKENINKKQNRGTIYAIGRLVDSEDWKEGDMVSFYRNAATPIMEDGVEYLSIHENFVLAKFKEA